MLKNIIIRIADEKDYKAILKIYEKYITDTLITFECKVPTLEDFSKRLLSIQKIFPLIVCEIENEVVGYAYISRFREREAYDWTVESSVYIKSDYHSMNIGKALYYSIIELSKSLGYLSMIGVVTIPNIKSDKLHHSFGFDEIGVLKNVGFKNGTWNDVKWYSLKLNDYDISPKKPKSVSEININELNNILNKAEQIQTRQL